jgi:rubrerythrin
MTGGFVSPWLENFVKSSLGHWEKSEYYCSDCGALMAMDDGFIKCPKCGKTYNEHK